MPVALEAAADLTAVAACLLLIGLLLAVSYTFEKLADVLNVGIGPYHPFGGIASAIRNTVLKGCQDGIKALETAVDGLLTGLRDSFKLMVGLTDDLLGGVHSAFAYLWNKGIVAKIVAFLAGGLPGIGALPGLYGFVKNAAGKLGLVNAADAEQIANKAASAARAAAEAYADTSASKALSEAESFAHAAIRVGVGEAEAYADAAVSKLRAAEEQAIQTANEIATAAERAADAAQATTTAALGAVKSVAVTAEQDIATVLGNLSATDAAALIASIPALGTLVYAIASEAGLSNAECRSKVKGICGTDPAQWGSLIAGLGIVTGLLSLEEIVGLARPMVGLGAAIVSQAA